MFEAFVLLGIVFGGFAVLAFIADYVIPFVNEYVDARIGAVVTQADEK